MLNCEPTNDAAVSLAASWSRGAIAALVSHVVGDRAAALPPVAIVLDLEPAAPLRIVGSTDTGLVDLLENLPDDGYLIISGDDEHAARLADMTAGHVLRVGRTAGCDLVAENIVATPGKLTFSCDATDYELPVSGRHAVAWALAAVAAGQIGCLNDKTIASRLASASMPAGYGDVSQHNGVAIVNHSAGGTLGAFCAGCEVFRLLAAERRVVLCGERSSREKNAASQRHIGKEIVTRCGADLLVVCGEDRSAIAAAAIQAGLPAASVVAVSDFAAAAAIVCSAVKPGDAVLVDCGRLVASAALLQTSNKNMRAA